METTPRRETEAALAWRQKVGARLRDARVAAGLTQSDVSKRLGHVVQWLSNIEKGRAGIIVDDLHEFARMYGYPVEHFLADRSTLSAFRCPTSLPEWKLMLGGDDAMATALFGMYRVMKEARDDK